MKSKIILICGPTATGKTKLSIALAKRFDAEIINADSTYIYKEPIIATNKITEEEMEGIKHHMIDIISLDDDYNIYNYQKEARKILDNLISQNKNVIIVGGSGLYIKSLLYDYELEDEEDDEEIDLSLNDNETLKKMADKIDPDNEIHINNRQRLERFISYNIKTGKSLNKTNKDIKKYDFISIGLTTGRITLYDVINNRVEQMFEDGLLTEASQNKKLKNFENIIGYKEMNDYFYNGIPLEDVKEMIKQNTRRYAKRQITWFTNQMDDIKWFSVDYQNFDNTVEEITEYIKNSNVN